MLRVDECDGGVGGGACRSATGARSAFVGRTMVRIRRGRPRAGRRSAGRCSRPRSLSLTIRRIAPGFAFPPRRAVVARVLGFGDAVFLVTRFASVVYAVAADSP